MPSQPCQRWQSGNSTYRSGGEVIDTSRYEVVVSCERDAKQFTQTHHYSKTYPAARYRVALMHKRAFHKEEIAGVAVFSVPMIDILPALKSGDSCCVQPNIGWIASAGSCC